MLQQIYLLWIWFLLSQEFCYNPCLVPYWNDLIRVETHLGLRTTFMSSLSFKCDCDFRAECSNLFDLYKTLVTLFDRELVPALLSVIVQDFIDWLRLSWSNQGQGFETEACSPWNFYDLTKLNNCELLGHICLCWLQAYDITVTLYTSDDVFYATPGHIVDI